MYNILQEQGKFHFEWKAQRFGYICRIFKQVFNSNDAMATVSVRQGLGLPANCCGRWRYEDKQRCILG